MQHILLQLVQYVVMMVGGLYSQKVGLEMGFVDLDFLDCMAFRMQPETLFQDFSSRWCSFCTNIFISCSFCTNILLFVANAIFFKL